MTAKVRLIAMTVFTASEIKEIPWRPLLGESTGGSAVAEFAGRACYQSWSRPNPATADNQSYINNILEMAHLSVLEHGSVSFYIEGISRSCTHEIVRHRHFSYSQLSQRYVDATETEFVTPPDAEADEYLQEILDQHNDSTISHYLMIAEQVERNIADEPGSKTEKRKRARQTARAVLGNNTETKIVVTGNLRAWRHFIHMRASAGADTEIRRLAVQILGKLQQVAPTVFNDFIVTPYGDEKIATSVLGREAE